MGAAATSCQSACNRAAEVGEAAGEERSAVIDAAYLDTALPSGSKNPLPLKDKTAEDVIKPGNLDRVEDAAVAVPIPENGIKDAGLENGKHSSDENTGGGGDAASVAGPGSCSTEAPDSAPAAEVETDAAVDQEPIEEMNEEVEENGDAAEEEVAPAENEGDLAGNDEAEEETEALKKQLKQLAAEEAAEAAKDTKRRTIIRRNLLKETNGQETGTAEKRFYDPLDRMITFEQLCDELWKDPEWRLKSDAEFEKYWEDIARQICEMKCKCAWDPATCTKGHLLVERKYADKLCDFCNCFGTDYRCEKGCNFDTCKKCYDQLIEISTKQAVNGVKCPAGHPLKKFDLSNTCDMCENIGTQFRCSQGCNYDMCSSCYGHMEKLSGRIQEAKRKEDEEKALAEAENKKTKEMVSRRRRFIEAMTAVIRKLNFWKLMKAVLTPWRMLTRRQQKITDVSG